MVVNIKDSQYDVYIGRGSPWGNPHKINKTRTRNEAINLFENSITPEFSDKIRKELNGKILGCHCYPKKCHGDVLSRIANSNKLPFN